MNYHNITHDDMLNGDGLRVVLWVAGCNHRCPNCQNPQTWELSSGIPFDNDAYEELCNELSHDYTKGITFSGGDPLHPANRSVVKGLIEKIKKEFPTKDIWIYTGYKWDEIKTLPLLERVDVVVDGMFEEQFKDVSAPWVGSINQRVIDVQSSLLLGKIVLH